MQNMSICPIEQSLLEIESSATTKANLTSFLFVFHAIVSKLLDASYEGKKQILEKNSELCALKLVNQDKLKEFLGFLGYNEEANYYIYQFSDENVIKLQCCLTILDRHIQKEQDAILADISNNHQSTDKDLERKIEPQTQSLSARSSQSSSQERAMQKEGSRSERLKDLLLSKHLKKEHSNDMLSLLKKDKRPTSRSSDFAFNTNGYFLQSGNKAAADSKRNNRSFMREIFHQQDHEFKGWSSSSLNAKLI